MLANDRLLAVKREAGMKAQANFASVPIAEVLAFLGHEFC
jgi:hypothetical protein